jgi:hypothetical protein
MSFFKKLLGGGRTEPVARIRVCIECGMPVDQHKDWCAIEQTRREMESKRTVSPPAVSSS